MLQAFRSWACVSMHCFHAQAVGRPDVIAMSSAMTALSGAHLWQKALLLFQRLPARSRDVVSYGAAMTAAAIGKHWELGLFWLMEMKKLNWSCFASDVVV